MDALLRNREWMRNSFGNDECLGNGGDLHRASECPDSGDGDDHSDVGE